MKKFFVLSVLFLIISPADHALLATRTPQVREAILAEIRKTYPEGQKKTGYHTVTAEDLKRVVRLDLRDKHIHYLEAGDFDGLVNLEVLHLENNRMKNSLVEIVGFILKDCRKLKVLSAWGNFFDGPLPEAIGRFASLQKLDLSNNLLNGPIPGSLVRLKHLQFLNLSRNFLGGPIPFELGELENLEVLLLYKNKLAGPLPESLKEPTRLEWADFHGNLFSIDGPPSPFGKAVLHNCSTVLKTFFRTLTAS